MADTPESKIFRKLADALTFHPAGAKLFMPDWALEPGDIVTVQSDGDDYDVPIYSMNFSWNGQGMADVQSTGNQKREPLSALRRKEYQSGRRGYGAAAKAEENMQAQYQHYVDQTDAYRKEIYTVSGVTFDSDGNVIYQKDDQGNYILDNAGNKIPVYDENSDGSISGQVIQSAQRMATIIKQSGTVEEVFSDSKQYYEGDRVIGPDGNPYRFINDHNPGPWKGDGEHGDVESLGTLQSQIDHNTENFNIFYGDVNSRLGTIEGSALWGDADELLAINGRIRVDAQTGRLIIEEGGGLYTERTTAGGTKVYSGIWDNGNLTAGAIVEKINNQSSEQEQTIYTIRADRINLDGYVTATTLDAFFIDVDNLFSTTGYFGGINVHSITTNGGSTGNDPGSITSDILYATSQLSIGHAAGSGGAAAGSFYYQGAEYTPKTVKKGGEVQNNIKLFGTGTDTEIDIGGSGILDASVANNVLTLTKSDGTTTVNFSKATALNTGSVEADGETKQAGWSSGMFTVIATQTNKNTSTNQYETNEVGRTTTSLTIPLGHWGDPTQSEDPNTYYQGISAVIGSSLSAVDTGQSIQVNAAPRYNAGKNSVGLAPMSYTAFDDENYPSSQTIYTDTTGRTDASGTEDNLHRDITLSLDVDDSYVYMKHGSDVIARITNTGSGAAYSDGYTDGQDNAFASIKSIEIDEGSASYASSNLSVNITAVSLLSLIKQDETTVQSDGESETVAQTLPVAVTNVTISDSSIVYNNNRTYTIGGSGGNVNIGAVNSVGGANIPVDTNAYPFTPTEALNDVNVVKGSWTGEAEKSIIFTTDAQSPNASAPKTLTLSTGQGSWTWTTVDDASFYQKEVQVKDSAITTAIMTEPVDLPDISVYVSGPGQQQDSWWKTEGTNANKYVVPASTANAYLTTDTGKQHSIGSGTGSDGIVVDPSQAIEHGKSLVSVTRTWTEYDGTPSGDTPLAPGKTYHLEVKKDSTTVYDELYTVPEQTAPTVNTWGLTHQTGTDYTYKASVNVNGTQYESRNLNATEAYNNGWTGAYQSVGIFPTAVADLVPGGSPITIYAQAKETSGSAKSNVASVQVKARALNLKDETFTANDTYAVPEGYDGYGAVTVNVQGSGSSDRRAVFLDNITLTAPTNPEPGFNWQFTESSFAHYTDPVSVETDATKKTQVTIDASAIYQAGLDAGGGGGGAVDVIKGDWSTASSTQVATCEFSTNTGGTPQSVTINQVADGSAMSGMGRLSVRDGQEIISTAYFRLMRDDEDVVLKYIPHSYETGISNVARIANYAANGQTIARLNVGSSEAPIIESDVADVVKNPTQNVTYSENYKTAYIPVQALDENDIELLSKTISVSVEGAWDAGHTKGLEDGSGIKIEQEKSVDVSQNNTTITVLPTYTGSDQYDAMGSVKVNVQIPTYEGISSAVINAQEETEQTWWRKELGKGTLSSQYGQIKVTGVDGSEKYYIVDASQVYQNGVNAGSGISIDHIRKSGTATFSASYKTVYFDATVYSSDTESSATALHTNQVQCDITAAWNDGQSKGYSSGYSQGLSDGGTIAKTEITCSSNVNSIGTNRGSRVNAGSISKSGLVANSYLGFAISVRGQTREFYISINP